MRGGLAETWAMVMAIYGGEAETPKIHTKPKVARAVFLPDPEGIMIETLIVSG